jgi:hypothetical protein
VRAGASLAQKVFVVPASERLAPHSSDTAIGDRQLIHPESL